MSSRHKHFYEFGSFRLDAANRQLLRHDRTVPLQPKAVDMLLLLVERRGEVLTKDELIQKLWPDSFVEESNLSQNIYVLRKALGQENEQEFIKTVPKRGYRFVADVREVGDADDAELIVEEHTQTRLTITQEEEQQQQSTAHVVPDQDAILIESRANLARGTRARFGRRRQALALAVGGLLLLCGLAALVYLRLARPRPAAARPHTIAILPFKRLSPNEGDEYLGVGLCDVLITKLSNLHQLVVRPTSAVLKFEGAGMDSVAAGRELQVESVLEGSLQRDGDRLRVTVRLLHVADGAPLWAGTFDESFSDMFKVQDAISERVTRALSLKLSAEEERRVAKRDTESVAAYEQYIKGRYSLGKRTSEELRKSIEHFGQAVSLDPNFALAYAGLAEAYNVASGYGGLSPKEAFPLAKEAATHALALDDKLAEARLSLAFIKAIYDWDWAAADREFRDAIGLNPNSANAHYFYGLYLMGMKRTDEGLAEVERARQLDPLSLIIETNLGRAYFWARQDDKALAQFRETLEIEPDFRLAYERLQEVYEREGRYDEAIATRARIDPPRAAALRKAYEESGARGYWRAHIEASMKGGALTSPTLRELARAYAALGERDEALAMLARAFDERCEWLIWLNIEPAWDELRTDARFAELLARVGLSP